MTEKDYLLILGVVSFLFTWLDIININKIYKQIILILILMFALYCGYINFPISGDYSIYKMYFDYSSGSFEFQYENNIYDYGYVWLNTLIKSLNGDLMTVYFFTCLISLTMYFVTFVKYTPYIFTAWYFLFARYFEVQNILQIRQGLACAIMLYSLKFVYERKLLKFVVCILIATLIHKSLIVALLIYPFSKIKWDEKKIIIVLLISFIFYMAPVTDVIFNTILPIFNVYIPKFDAYIGTSYMIDIEISNLIFRICSIVFFAYFLLKKKYMAYNNIFISMLMLGFIVLCIFSDFAVLSGRLASIFFLAYTFIPTVLLDYGNAKQKIYILLLLNFIGLSLIIKNYLI